MDDESDNWKNAHNGRDLFLSQVIKPLLPNAEFSFTIQNGDYTNPSNTFYGILSTNDIFKNSIYAIENDNNLLHFTSLQSLFSILHNGFFRMTELSALDDVNEMSYASKVFENNSIFRFNESAISKSKSKLFCLSACKYHESTIQNSYMWESYGAKGKGVIIEFAISNYNAHLFSTGIVKYGSDELEPIRQLKSRAEEFYSQHDLFPHNPIELFSMFKSFHKSFRYHKEKEVRLLFTSNFFGNKTNDYPTLYQDINRNNQVKYFNKVFLTGNVPKEFMGSNHLPEITIKKVILGYGLEIEEKLEIAKSLNSFLNDNFSFEIFHIDNELNLIDLTHLSKF